jgi:hypothetical protein
MFHHVCNVHFVALDAYFIECTVEQRARRANEGTPGKILFIAGLLAYEHHLGACRAFAEDGLRPTLPQVASLA